MINCCSKPFLFRDISTSKNDNDPSTSFSQVNFTLVCFVNIDQIFQGSEEFEIEQIYRPHIFYNTQA